jgi:hypothetical protein
MEKKTPNNLKLSFGNRKHSPLPITLHNPFMGSY